MFIPGETITHQFIIPFVRSDLEKIIVSYRQDDDVILIKTVYPGQVEDMGSKGKFAVTLSQEESLLFDDAKNYFIQLNVLMRNSARCASVEIKGTNGIQHIEEAVVANV